MADATTPSEEMVQFINSEVLDPPEQGNISFVKPYVEQTLAMALEDARSFLQGAEQILLIALAKALEKALSGGAPALDVAALTSQLSAVQPNLPANVEGPEGALEENNQNTQKKSKKSTESSAETGPETQWSDAQQAQATAALLSQISAASSPAHAAPTANLDAIGKVMENLAKFHASVADTAIRHKGDR